jgi:DNA/RNA-binding domain of Phe-tRNA-synthetase-like protein
VVGVSALHRLMTETTNFVLVGEVLHEARREERKELLEFLEASLRRMEQTPDILKAIRLIRSEMD